jgi:hypothetical protein
MVKFLNRFKTFIIYRMIIPRKYNRDLIRKVCKFQSMCDTIRTALKKLENIQSFDVIMWWE